jgi:hypothetical protein
VSSVKEESLAAGTGRRTPRFFLNNMHFFPMIGVPSTPILVPWFEQGKSLIFKSDFPWFESKKGALVLVVLVVLLIMVEAVISAVLASSSCTTGGENDANFGSPLRSSGCVAVNAHKAYQLTVLTLHTVVLDIRLS